MSVPFYGVHAHIYCCCVIWGREEAGAMMVAFCIDSPFTEVKKEP